MITFPYRIVQLFMPLGQYKTLGRSVNCPALTITLKNIEPLYYLILSPNNLHLAPMVGRFKVLTSCERNKPVIVPKESKYKNRKKIKLKLQKQ